VDPKKRVVDHSVLSQGKHTVHELFKSVVYSRYAGRAGGALVCLLAACIFAQARVHHSQGWADIQFAKAEAQRQTLNGRAEQSRARREYEAVIASYRRVVLEAPASAKADASAFAVAEVTAEMGRHFKDDNALFSAVREYKFLRREYPGSKHRIEALLAIGEIYKNDLGDDTDARGALEELLRRYPRSKLADEAKAELATAGARETQQAEQPSQTGDSEVADRKPASPDKGAEKPVRVTAVQKESDEYHTRITVELEKDVQFESQRLGDPQRIFFDLKNARLSQELLGKSLDVDDAFVKKIRMAQFKPGRARIVVETAAQVSYNASLSLNPPRLVIDVHRDNAQEQKPAEISSAGSSSPAADLTPQPGSGIDHGNANNNDKVTETTTADGVKKVVVEPDSDEDSGDSAEVQTKVGPKPTVKQAKAASNRLRKANMSDTRAMREAQPTSSGDRSLIRALGLKIGKIVIDPGHGGHDTGTIGPHGLLEKDLVLDVGRRLGKLLQARLGADVVFTRRDDTFIPLETRTAIANQEQADLFVSVHANSSRDPDARGVETYYLNFTSSPEALEVAARENAASDKSIHELQDLVKKIALKEKIEESREFASDIQDSLHNGLAAKGPAIRDRGVKKAPFVVLIGANMPSILAEISFISNPADERRLKSPDYRQRIAESLYRGIARYVNGLGGVKVAGRIEKNSAD
jgi:N-acetylmuramoyl-L-alanine amidase